MNKFGVLFISLFFVLPACGEKDDDKAHEHDSGHSHDGTSDHEHDAGASQGGGAPETKAFYGDDSKGETINAPEDTDGEHGHSHGADGDHSH